MLVQHIMLQITNKDQLILTTQHIPIQIQVLTPQPPYTKIQFTFQTEQIMMETFDDNVLVVIHYNFH